MRERTENRGDGLRRTPRLLPASGRRWDLDKGKERARGGREMGVNRAVICSKEAKVEDKVGQARLTSAWEAWEAASANWLTTLLLAT